MLGAIIGDVVGSRFEFNNIKWKDFDLITNKNTFTDDTILTVALMDWLLHSNDFGTDGAAKYLQKWGRKYPSSYGGRFSAWLRSNNPQPYGSYGNGSAMRISPVAYAAKDMDELRLLVLGATTPTHNSVEGMKGATAIATAIYMALHGSSKASIHKYAISVYPEIAKMKYQDLVDHYQFDETCRNTCPQALYCFLISKDFEDCLRTSVSIGGDTDTLCAMSCAIAEAFYGHKTISEELIMKVMSILPNEMADIIEEFSKIYERWY